MKPHLGIVILFFSNSERRIITRFLQLIEIEKTDSQTIFDNLDSSLSSFGLEYKNLVRYGSDGAAVVTGKFNSVWTRIYAKNPNVIRFTCLCHSLNKVAEEAFAELPTYMSGLLINIPKWFKKSHKRKSEYQQLFDSFKELISNNADDINMPFKTYSQTRWLCRSCIIERLIDN